MEGSDALTKEMNEFFAFTQVIQTSHSTHLASKSDLKNIVVIQKKAKKTKAVNIDSVLKRDEAKYKHRRRVLRQYLDATRSALLFAKNVVLVEGLSEKYVLGTIINSYLINNNVDGYNGDMDSEGIEIVEVGGKNFDPFSSLYGTEGLQNKCLSLSDGDIHLSENLTFNYADKYRDLNPDIIAGTNIKALSKKNIFTFEIDAFFLPNPDDVSINNVDYLKLVLYRFMKDGDYFKKEGTFADKMKVIDKLEKNIKENKANKEDISSFFNEILANEVSKPSLALYLASLLKAKLLKDSVETEVWTNGYTPEVGYSLKNFDDLSEFVIPKYIEDGIVWLITD